MISLADTTFVEAGWIMVVKSLVIFGVIFAILPLMTVLERKLIGRFQHRYGPNRVGPFGILQPLADVGKLLSKEAFMPANAIPTLFVLGPLLPVLSGVLALAIIPWGDVQDGVGFYGIDVPIGVLYFFAVGSIAFYGVLLGGWASGSKYSLLGAMRGAAQLISYEVAMGLALLGAILMGGSLSLVDLVKAQGEIWYIVPQFVGFLIFMLAGFAETNRTPVRHAGGRRRTRPGIHDRVRRDAVRQLPAGRIHGDPGRLRDRGGDLPRRLDGPRAELPRPDLDAGQDHGPDPGLHLGPGDAAAAALRPADEPGMEGAAAARDAEHAGHRGPGGRHMTEFRYLDDQDVVEVQRGPEPGGVGGAYRAFGETLRGLKTTMARLIEGPLTIQYPEEKTPVYPRFRGRHKLHRFEDTGLEKCVGCSLCAAACPADCIRVVAAENIPGERVSAGERYAAVYEINLSRCIFCGYCEIACPFDAITMGHDYEMADYDRENLIFTKEMLLADSIERTPLRSEGE